MSSGYFHNGRGTLVVVLRTLPSILYELSINMYLIISTGEKSMPKSTAFVTATTGGLSAKWNKIAMSLKKPKQLKISIELDYIVLPPRRIEI